MYTEEGPSPSEHSARPAPPTQPQNQPPQGPQTSWPGTVGVICIVWSALTLLGGFCGIIGTTAFSDFLDDVSPGAKDWQSWTILLQVFAIGLATLLLVAGIGLQARRPSGRKWGLIYGLVAIPIYILSSVIQFWMQKDIMSNDGSIGQFPGSAATADMFTGVVAVVGLLISLALPVFLLIWLSRSRIKAEVAGWQQKAVPTR